MGIGSNLLIVMRPDGSVAEKVSNPKALRASLADLRRANRALARKTEGSSRWRKAKRKLARTHARAANIRSDTIHKATTSLAKTHGTVVIEDLQVRQLARRLRSHRKAWIDASARRVPPPARVQDRLVQVRPVGRRPLVYQLEDLLRVRASQQVPDARR